MEKLDSKGIIEAFRGGKFKRGDTRQAAREQDKLESTLARILKEILNDIEEDGYVISPERYAARWRNFAHKWNSENTICYAYPEYIADYLLNQDVDDDCQPYKIQEGFTI